MTSDADWHRQSQPEPAQQEQARQDHSDAAQNEAQGDGADVTHAAQGASGSESSYRGDGGGQALSFAGRQSAGGNGHDAASEPAATEIAEVEIASGTEFEYEEDVPGYEPSASDCLNRAMRIARSLNHTSLSADHLMLALTMDQNARKLLERAGDINALRETAMQQLGKMNWKFARPSGRERNMPMQTSDLEDIHKIALHAAAEREQRVAISDLINAFPHEQGQLAYGAREELDVPAVIERIESGIAPRVAEVMSRFQGDLREAAQRELNTLVREVAEPQLTAAVQRQVASMDEINRQFRGLLESSLNNALGEFKAKLLEAINEAEPVQQEHAASMRAGDNDSAGTAPMTVTTKIPPTRTDVQPRRYWNWMALL